MKKLPRRICGAAAVAAASLALASTAGAVDLRDWGRKYNTASERFVVLASFNNDAVLDKETQLVWQISPYPADFWDTAVYVCYGSSRGGRSGWRMPSFSELRSLAATQGKLPSGHPFKVGNAQFVSLEFWSSTDRLSTATSAFTADLLSGQYFTRSKFALYPYLCVRGTGVADR